jgi:hypothetical protein
MGMKLRLGISEDRDFAYEPIPGNAFNSNGRYRAALTRLNRLLNADSTREIYSKYWDRCLKSGGTLPAATFEEAVARLQHDMRWILIYEAEHARIWKEGPPDYMTALRNYKRSAREDSIRIKNAIEELRRFDKRHAYLLRHALDHALQDFLSEEKVRRIKIPNPNADRGFEWRTVSGPQVRQHEFQYLSRVSLFRFDELLDSWERQIEDKFREWPAHWLEFGALRFDRPISRAAAAKLNVPQLGLIARLTSRLRDFTAGYGIWSYGTGQPVPDHGRPCWEIVAEFVNCALEPPNPLTGDTARRIWQSIASKHEIRMQSWPRPPRSESQVEKI